MTSRSTSARGPSTSASPAGTCCATPARTRRRCLPLGFGRSRFRFAGPAGRFTSLDQLAGNRIATSYVGVVSQFLAERGIAAEVVRLDGAVETSIQLGVADAIADVVETGSTLRQAGLEVFGETILDSEAVLITRQGQEPPGFEVFKRRIEGVLVARAYVMMDYDIAEEHVARAVELTPGIEGPTSRRCAARAGSRSGRWCRGPARSGSWTSSTRSAPAGSWSPTSMPAASELPITWRPLGPRVVGIAIGAGLLVICVVLVVHLRRRDPRAVHAVPAGTLLVLGLLAFSLLYGLLRSRVEAHARPARRRQRLPPPRVRVGARSSPSTCRPVRPG